MLFDYFKTRSRLVKERNKLKAELVDTIGKVDEYRTITTELKRVNLDLYNRMHKATADWKEVQKELKELSEKYQQLVSLAAKKFKPEDKQATDKRPAPRKVVKKATRKK